MRRRDPELSGFFDWWKKKPEAPRGERPPLHVDLYQALGVSPSASPDEIKSAFRTLALRYHPDRNPGDAAAERKYIEISSAYSVLSDEAQRRAYDRVMAAQAPPAPPQRSLIPTEEIPPHRRPEKPPQKGPAKPRPSGPTLWEIIGRKAAGEEKTPEKDVFGVFSKTPRPPQIPSARDPYAWATPRASRVPLTPGIDMPSEEEVYQAILLWPLDGIWDLVRAERNNYAFQKAGAMAVDVVAGAGTTPAEWEIADMFGIPLRQAEEFIRHRGRDAFYQEILYPLFDYITQLFSQIKPPDIPGQFFLDWDRDGKALEFIYTEQPGRRP